MQNHEREFLVSRIAAGYLLYKTDSGFVKIHYPDKDIMYEGNFVYKDAYNLALEHECMTEEEVVALLTKIGLWSEKKEEEYQKIVPGHIEYWKKELYRAKYNSDKRLKIRKYLQAAKDYMVDLTETRTCLDYATCVGIANYSKWFYMIAEKGVRDDLDRRHINKFDILSYYYANIISDTQIRELAHTSPWDIQWSSSKKEGTIFGRGGMNLTIDQQRLIMWSSLYDAISEASESPPNEVIEDDDMLDGWLIIKREEREKEHAKIEGESLLSDKVKNADEIYIPVGDINDAKKIESMNSQRAKRIKQQRKQLLDKKGTVKETEFLDVKEKYMMQATEAMRNKMRSR